MTSHAVRSPRAAPTIPPPPGLPVVVIAGRPNVGKSTLFNALTRSREALVADRPGVTRDRHYGLVQDPDRPYVLVDTGGLSDDAEGLEALAQEQVAAALAEASVVLAVFDARAGLNAADRTLAAQLRRLGKPLIPVLNKCEGLGYSAAAAEAAALGLGEVVSVSAAHRQGLDDLGAAIAAHLPAAAPAAGPAPAAQRPLRLAFMGRPNVGKSTLINRLVGEERLLTADIPGVTRDVIRVPFGRDGQDYLLIDTAGIRRRARVADPLEKLSVIKSLQVIAEADVVVLLLDAADGAAEQDMRLLGMLLDNGRALVIAINKWDGLTSSDRRRFLRDLERRCRFADYVEKIPISARHGSGLGELMAAVQRAAQAAARTPPSKALTTALTEALAAHPPPLSRGRTASLRYAHIGGVRPLTIVIHGNRTATVPASYKRYLAAHFRRAFKLTGVPLAIVLKEGENPYAGQRNPLTARQIAKRRRLMQHVKR